jgi:hypothetical protein
LFEESKKTGTPWLISDFLTLGSPLSHAQLLMADGKDGLNKFREERTFPTCPPTLEHSKRGETFTFDKGLRDENNALFVVPHHAALFAVTRWTNVWFKNDFVGGPMQSAFGKAIKDIPLVSKVHPKFPFLSHTFYWDKKELKSLDHIKKVVFPH